MNFFRLLTWPFVATISLVVPKSVSSVLVRYMPFLQRFGKKVDYLEDEEHVYEFDEEEEVKQEENKNNNNNNNNNIVENNRNIVNTQSNSSELLISVHKKTVTQPKRKRSHSRSKSYTEEELLSPPREDSPKQEEEKKEEKKEEEDELKGFFFENNEEEVKKEIKQESNNIIILPNIDDKNDEQRKKFSKKQISSKEVYLNQQQNRSTSLLPLSPQPKPEAKQTVEKPRSPSFHRRSRSVVSFESALSPTRPTCPYCGVIISTVLKENFCTKCGGNIQSITNSEQSEGWIDPIERKKTSHVDLFIQVKGRRHLQIRQVELTNSSLNHGDVFILDCNTKIFQWNGRQANRMEKAKATDVCLRIKEKERIGKAEIIIIEDGFDVLKDDIYNEKDLQRFENYNLFWKTLQGKPDYIKSEEEGGIDDQNIIEDILYKVDEDILTGRCSMKPVNCPKLMKEYLHSDGCYILDCNSEFWLWRGKKSSARKRRDLESLGKELFASKSDSRPAWASVYSMWEGSEKVLFMEKFVNWGKLPINVQPAPIIEIKKQLEKEFDVRQMLFTIEELNEQKRFAEREIVRSGLAKRKGPPDDGKQGSVRIWRSARESRHEITPAYFGHFWEEDSYIVLYSFKYNRHDEHIIYFWQGALSPITIKGASAVLTIFLNSLLEGCTEQIRVPQYKEPEHFINIFDLIVIHKGSTPSFVHLPTTIANNSSLKIEITENITQKREKSLEIIDPFSLVTFPIFVNNYYHIRGRYVVEINEDELLFYLNGNDSFLLPSTKYNNNDNNDDNNDNNNDDNNIHSTSLELKIWNGMHSSSVTKNTAILLSTRLNQVNKRELNEENFYQIINDDDLLNEKFSEYHHQLKSEETSVLSKKQTKARLFHSTHASGFYTCDEIADPCQTDFDETSLYIVDCHPDAIFVWEGKRASQRDRKRTLEISIQYRNILIEHYKLDVAIPILNVKQGEEPISLTSHFQGWRRSFSYHFANDSPNSILSSSSPSLTSKPTPILLSSVSSPSLLNKCIDVEEEIKKYDRFYTLAELQMKPSHLDLTQLEMYLSDEEFLEVFKVTKNEWPTLQSWKRTGLRKNARLF